MSNLGNCAHCGNPKTPRVLPSGKVEVDSRVIRRRYCSEDCRSAASNDFPLRPCDQCGQDIPRRVYPSRGKLESASTYNKRRFCSRKCQGAAVAHACGTPAGPNRHRLRGEDICDACHAANVNDLRRKTLVARGIDPGSVTHGSFSGGMVGCLCRDCLPWRPVAHGTAHAYDEGCRCRACTQAKTVDVDRWRREAPDKFEAAINRWKTRQKRMNDESRERAHHWHYQWTGPELEIAAREDLTAAEVAALLGRTIAGVRTIRRRLQDDADALRRGGLTSHSRPKRIP